MNSGEKLEMAMVLEPEQLEIIGAVFERSSAFLEAILDVPPPRESIARYILWRSSCGEIEKRALFEAVVEKFRRPPGVMVARTLQRRYCG